MLSKYINLGVSVGAVAFALLASGPAQALDVTYSLGASTQDYVLFGQGPYALNLGSFTNQQGAESINGTLVTDTLSGLITGSSDPAYASGNYSFVTTYNGTGIGSGGQEIQSHSNSINPDFFNYSFLDPSVNMTLFLTNTPGGDLTIPIVTNGSFDTPGFGFAYVSATCTGVSTCTQNDVGLTPGATESGPVTISVTASAPAVPEPSTWAMMLLGLGAVGFAMRQRRQDGKLRQAT